MSILSGAGPETVVNTYTNRWQDHPDVTRLVDGSYWIVWRSFFDEDFGSVFYIGGQRFDAAGNLLGTEQILSDVSQYAEHPRIKPLADGGFVLVYEASAGITGDDAIYLGQYDADGTARGAVQQISPDTGIDYFDSEVVPLANGNALVLFSGVDESAFQDLGFRGIEAQVIAPGGSFVGERFGFNIHVLGDQAGTRAVQLANGNVAVLYESGFFSDLGVSPPSGGTVRFKSVVGQIVDASGQPVGGEFVVSETVSGNSVGTPGLTNTALDVDALANGGFVAVWEDSDRTPFSDTDELRGQILLASGGRQGTHFIIAEDDEYRIENPSVAGLEGGGFVVVYEVFRGLSTFADIVGRVYTSGGQPVGDAFEVGQVNARSQEHPEVAALADGGFVVTWQSDEIDGDDFGVAARVFAAPDATDLSLTGTPDADVLIGLGGNDLIRALAGDDMVEGAAGNDTLDGGTGTDTIQGGAGADIIDGGPAAGDLRDVVFAGEGNDTVTGGAGNDLLYGQAGNDVMDGGIGADEIIGNAGNDALSGSALSDLIFGGPGDDFMNGGFGFDRVNGGDGADRFFHIGALGHGSDWIQDYSAAEGDQLVYGANATINQFQVNLANTANAGDAGVAEAFVIYRPTGQILWALVDGGAQDALMLVINGQNFDLL